MYSFWRPTYAEFRKELDNNPGVWSFKRHLHRRNPFLGWIQCPDFVLRCPTAQPIVGKTFWWKEFRADYPFLELTH